MANNERTFEGVAVGMQIRGAVAKTWVYQVRDGVQIKYPWKKPANPQTEAQQAWRSDFADAIVWAKALNEETKDYYKSLVADPSILPGYPNSSFSGRSWFNYAVSDYLLSL